jgi:uncharacterized membrane protein
MLPLTDCSNCIIINIIRHNDFKIFFEGVFIMADKEKKSTAKMNSDLAILFLPIGIAIGVIFGMIFGIVFNNVSIGVAVGLGIGAIAGGAVSAVVLLKAMKK